MVCYVIGYTTGTLYQSHCAFYLGYNVSIFLSRPERLDVSILSLEAITLPHVPRTGIQNSSVFLKARNILPFPKCLL